MLDKIFQSKTFLYICTPALFLLACAVTLSNREVEGAILFGYIASFFLIASSHLTDAMYPALLLCVFVTRCYDSADTFLAKLPYLVPIVLAVVAHFILYKRTLRVGRSFFGVCAVALAVTLGGVGTISPGDYFAPGALYYTFALGIGMVVFYLLVKANFTEKSGREVARILYLTGLFACFCVLRFYLEEYQSSGTLSGFINFQSGNNLATFLMLALPVPLFYASRRCVDLLSVLLMYACLLLSGSRGGLLMGTVEFIVVLVAFALLDKRRIFNRILYALIVPALILTLFLGLEHLVAFYKIQLDTSDGAASLPDLLTALKQYLITEKDVRLSLLERVSEDFRRNPLFGSGIGYKGNEDLYAPVKGAMNWYHMWFAQVVGSLGLVGIAAYGYQLVGRARTFWRDRSLLHLTLLLSYIGLFLMSQVNPGEFCPMPYAALAVTLFIVMEKPEDDVTLPVLGQRIKTALQRKKVPSSNIQSLS